MREDPENPYTLAEPIREAAQPRDVGNPPSPLLGSPPEGTATFTHGARENRGEQAATCERIADGARGPTVPAVTVIRPGPCGSAPPALARRPPSPAPPCGSGSHRSGSLVSPTCSTHAHGGPMLRDFLIPTGLESMEAPRAATRAEHPSGRIVSRPVRGKARRRKTRPSRAHTRAPNARQRWGPTHSFRASYGHA